MVDERSVMKRTAFGICAHRSSKRWFWQWGVPLLVLAACGGRGRADARQVSADESTLGDTSTQTSAEFTSEDDVTATASTPSASTGETSVTAPTSTTSNPSEASTAPEPLTTDVSTPTNPTSARDSNGSNSNSSDSTSGDSTSSGSPNTVLMPATPTPGLVLDHCDSRNGRESAVSCELGTWCDGYSDLIECSRSNSGSWNCRCRFNNKEREYEIKDVAGIDACAVASRFCDDYDLELGDEVCETDTNLINQDGPSDGCEQTLTCGRTITVAPEVGASVRLVDINQAECWPTADGRFECRCSGRPVNELVVVEATSPAAACSASRAYCHGETDPIEGPEECVSDRDVAPPPDWEWDCMIEEECVVPVASSGDAIIHEPSYRAATCRPLDDETSRCYCFHNESSLVFDVPSTEASCETARLGCTQQPEILPAGDVTCNPSSQYGSGDTSCEADLDCRQPATIAGQSVLAEGLLRLRCSRDELDEPWRCACRSNDNLALFEYGAPEQTAWQVCAAAAGGCLEHMNVHLGGYENYDYPPYPWDL